MGFHAWVVLRSTRPHQVIYSRSPVVTGRNGAREPKTRSPRSSIETSGASDVGSLPESLARLKDFTSRGPVLIPPRGSIPGASAHGLPALAASSKLTRAHSDSETPAAIAASSSSFLSASVNRTPRSFPLRSAFGSFGRPIFARAITHPPSSRRAVRRCSTRGPRDRLPSRASRGASGARGRSCSARSAAPSPQRALRASSRTRW